MYRSFVFFFSLASPSSFYQAIEIASSKGQKSKMASKVVNIDLLAFVSMATKPYINTELKFIDACLLHH